MLHYGPYLLFVSGPMASLFGDFNSSHGSESRNGLGTVSIQTLDQNGDNLDAWKIETLTLIQGVGAPHLLQQEGNRRYTGTRYAGNPVVNPMASLFGDFNSSHNDHISVNVCLIVRM